MSFRMSSAIQERAMTETTAETKIRIVQAMAIMVFLPSVCERHVAVRLFCDGIDGEDGGGAEVHAAQSAFQADGMQQSARECVGDTVVLDSCAVGGAEDSQLAGLHFVFLPFEGANAPHHGRAR